MTQELKQAYEFIEGELREWVKKNSGEKIFDSEIIVVENFLQKLIPHEDWSEEKEKQFDLLIKKFEIEKKIFISYKKNFLAHEKKFLDQKNFFLFQLILFRRALFAIKNNFSREKIFKIFNALFKSFEKFSQEKLQKNCQDIFNYWQKSLQKKISKPTPVVFKKNDQTLEKKILDLNVLFYEGPIGRAYLATLKSLCIVPKKIIHIVFTHDSVSKKPIARVLPKIFREIFMESIEREKIHHWPRVLRNKKPQVFEQIKKVVSKELNFTGHVIEDAQGLSKVSSYAQNYEKVFVKNLKDPNLGKFLSKQKDKAWLFCGGGIVPKSILSLPEKKFIHIHPGFLPKIRGADCMLWSHLLSERFSASAFYMAEKIDEGDIINRYWLPNIELSLSHLQEQDFYRALYSFLDPWIRAFVLREMLVASGFVAEYDKLKTNSQNEFDGETFHFMCDEIRALVFKSFSLVDQLVD